MPNRTFYTPRIGLPSDIDLRSDVISGSCCFNKGYTPPPFKLTNETVVNGVGKVTVTFEINEFTESCRCMILCSTGALFFTDDEVDTDPSGQFCPADKEFEVVLPETLFDEVDPTKLIFNFEDSTGNISSVEIYSLVTVVPQTPLLLLVNEGPRQHIQIGTPIYSAGYSNLTGIATQYQIERYARSESSRETWVDWTDIPVARPFHRGGKDLVHWDRDIRPDVKYGYRVRFRSTFDETSQWSGWRTLLAEAAEAAFYYSSGAFQQINVGEYISIFPSGASDYTYFKEVN